jgi:hypothetical protein
MLSPLDHCRLYIVICDLHKLVELQYGILLSSLHTEVYVNIFYTVPAKLFDFILSLPRLSGCLNIKMSLLVP